MPPDNAQSSQRELQAFIHFFATFELSRPLNRVDDLNDGTILYDILSLAYARVVYELSWVAAH